MIPPARGPGGEDKQSRVTDPFSRRSERKMDVRHYQIETTDTNSCKKAIAVATKREEDEDYQSVRHVLYSAVQTFTALFPAITTGRKEFSVCHKALLAVVYRVAPSPRVQSSPLLISGLVYLCL